MFNSKATIVGLTSVMLLVSFVPTSNAELWELIIDLNVEKGVIYPGETVVITGKVVDHAYDPIRGAEVLVRTGSTTTKAFTDPDGVFKAEFKDFKKIAGTYTVNVIATWYGMTGLSTIQFEVKGDASKVSTLQEQLSTEQARKYLSSKESAFEKDPIGQTLFKYYHGLLQKLILEKKESLKPIEDQVYLEQQRAIAEKLRSQAIEEYKPSAGTYGGYKYDDYIKNLNPEIRELVKSQLNFTKNTFENAQQIRDEILANGGTYEEARQAYLDLITIPKDVLEKFNQENLEDSEKTPESADENQPEESSENQ